MLITSWYYDERSQEFKKTSLKELKRLEYDNKEEFLYIKERLYRSQNKSVPMILVRKGLNQGFRRKGNSTGNHTSKSSSKMAEVIGVSEAQLRFVTNTASGMGLIKCGSVVIPFDNQISKDTDLYRLYNTNIHEKIAEQKKRDSQNKISVD